MSEKLRIGVIGGGAITQQGHLPFYDLSPHVASIVVADPCQERLDEIRNTFKKVENVYADYRDMLDREKLDCVSICTPNHLHAEATFHAIRRGAHVLCEKPMALDLDDADRMIDAAREKDVLLMTNFTHRFFNGSRKIKELLDEGAIGSPHSIHIRYVHDGPYAGWAKSDWFYEKNMSGGGALMDMGVHAVDICRYFLGPVRTVTASLANLVKKIPVEDSAMLMVECGGGVRGFIEAGWTGGTGFTGIELFGSRGGVVMD